MAFNAEAAQLRWDNLIKRNGDRGVLRQPGRADRPISVSIQQATPMERLNQASNPLDQIAIVSPLDPDTGLLLDPDPSERDAIVVDGQLFKIFAPPDGMGASLTKLYWRIMVRA